MSLEAEVGRLERDAGRILEVLASQSYSAAALERQKKELARLRALLDKARRRALKQHREALEADAGLDELPESRLAAVEDALARLDAHDTAWGRALAALELAMEGAAEGPRRLAMKGADRARVASHAAARNHTTAVADLAASALALLDSAPRPADDDEELGRSLRGQRLIEAALAPEDG